MQTNWRNSRVKRYLPTNELRSKVNEYSFFKFYFKEFNVLKKQNQNGIKTNLALSVAPKHNNIFDSTICLSFQKWYFAGFMYV